MISSMPSSGLALLCDEQGTIQRVIRDELDLAGRLVPGRSLTHLVDRRSRQKALNFLMTLRNHGVAFGWELNVFLAGEVTSLHFAGAANEGQLLIVGAKTSNDMMQLYEELTKIGNEQMNALRAALKARSDTVREQADRDSALYDELSRLNNELANLQRELVKKNAELERLNEQKNRFLGMAAHDLHNPLSLILAYSKFLMDEAAETLSEEHVEFLSIIQSSSNFMVRLVNDLLDVTKIESGKLELDLQPTDLVKLVERNVTLNRVLAERKGIALRFQGDADLPPLLVDGAKIEQVLNNLISNAIKFSHSETIITVRVVKQEDRAVITVQDRGQGIPANELDRLFKPFVKTSVRSTGGEKSTGLGLVIAKKVVEGHSGEIHVESQVGQGSTFYVALPIK